MRLYSVFHRSSFGNAHDHFTRVSSLFPKQFRRNGMMWVRLPSRVPMFHELPPVLLRKMFDDVWVCIYCTSKKTRVDHADPVIRALLDLRPDKHVRCKKCNAHLVYLDERTYNLSYTELRKRQREYDAVHKVWSRLPLWALTRCPLP